MLIHRVTAPLALLVAASTSVAQVGPVNGMRPSEPARHAIVGATVIVAPGQTIEKATIVIRDGVIESIGPEIAVPAGYRTFDFAGKTVFPAFIEAALPVDSAALVTAASSAPGAHWNQYVTPEVSARELAIPDATLDALRAQGFAIARVLPSGGILRGTSDMRVLTKSSERSLGFDLGGRVAQNMGPRSFDFSRFFAQQTPGTPPPTRGERTSSYPSSLMGSYALMRQTLLDAKWRRAARQVPQALLPVDDMNALDALLPLVAGDHSIVLDASDELDAARLVRLVREELPGTAIELLGGGNEFRMQSELASLLGDGTALILPIEFPQAPDLVSPTASDTISLRDLMTWRYAPTNPKRFIAAGTTVALTTNRMQDKGSFRKRLADAIAHGVTRDEALAALTTVPARILGIESRAGTLEPGRMANLVVSSGDPFDAESKFEAMFVAGIPVQLPQEDAVLAAGDFKVVGEASTPKPIAADLRIAIDPKDGVIKATWTAPATEGESKDEAKADPDGDAGGSAAPASEAAADNAKSDATKDPSSSATARRASVSRDGRASGILEGTPFGFTGDVRIAIAGRGDRAVLTVEASDGTRATLSLERIVEQKSEAKSDEQPDAKADATPEAKAEAKSDDADTRPRRGRRGPRASDETQAASAGDEGKQGDEKKPDDRGDLWKDALPFPLGEYGVATTDKPTRVFVRGATIWTLGPAGTLEGADMIVEDGRIAAIGKGLEVPEGATVIDGTGMHVTPGLIDCHSHTGISGGVNEGTQANTAEVTIEDVIDPTDIEWYRQLAGGLTAVNQLHGSANPIGGRNSVVKIRWGEGADAFRFEGAPKGIKFALGENVTRPTARYPTSRMGVATYLDDSFMAAREYRAARSAYDALGDDARARTVPPRIDLELETLAEIIEGTRLVHCHSYRQDEILMLLRTAERFGFRVATLQHVLEGYKVAPEIAAHGAGASSFSDWWAYKIEVMDAIPWNGAMLHRAGVLVSFNSDSDELARRMNMEAAKAVRYGGLSPEEALKLVTLNPARQLRIDHRVGSLEPGKDADFAIWNGDPLSAFTRCEQTWIDGVQRYSRTAESEMHGTIARARGELIAKAVGSADARGGSAAGGPGGGRGFRGGRGRPTSLMERMLEDRENTIWLRIARGLEPIPTKQGDCGCGAIGQPVPVESLPAFGAAETN
ncbi:MAG: hypothetical protein RL136_1285 [Planctomycetota bacterium]|jgi:N-acetylglucosamine-6-phosphate deacetylase